MGNLVFAAFSGLMALLNLGPLYWQIMQGNSGPISMGLWVILLNVVDFINVTVWFNNMNNRAPVWCDISVKLQPAAQVGRLASVMCISRFLAAIVSPRAVAATRQDRRMRAIFDYSICFGVPFLVMACQIVYQPRRFAIVRNLGCGVVSSMTWPTLILWLIWPPVFATVGVLYSFYVIFRIAKHRHDFGKIVSGAQSAVSTSRFIRLAMLSFSYLAIGLPLCIYTTILDITSTSKLYFDYSWVYLHSDWSRGGAIVYVDGSNAAGLSPWSNVVVAIIFFSAFGFGTEALTMYSRIANLLRTQAKPPLLAHPIPRGRLGTFTTRSGGRREATSQTLCAERVAAEKFASVSQCMKTEVAAIRVHVEKQDDMV